MADDGSEEKVFDPSQRRLRRLREDGQVARSAELTGAVGLAVVMIFLVVGHGAVLARLQAIMTAALGVGGGDPWAQVRVTLGLAAELGQTLLLPLAALVVGATLLSTVLDLGGFLFTLKPLTPNFGRLDPIAGMGRLFTVRSLIELAKALVKICLLAGVLYAVLRGSVNAAFWAPLCGVPCVLEVGLSALGWIFWIGLDLMMTSVLVDLPLARWLFKRDNRMTRTDMKREAKDDQGDPHVRQARNADRRSMASEPALGKREPNILVLGDGLLVGVLYDQEIAGVPLLLTKVEGGDQAAMTAAARRGGALVHRDLEVADLLFRKGRRGQPVPRETFAAIARAIVLGREQPRG